MDTRTREKYRAQVRVMLHSPLTYTPLPNVLRMRSEFFSRIKRQQPVFHRR